MSGAPDYAFEAAKLIAQFCGALAIAWLTVRWALGRFKTEKMWERQISALADVLSALREMQRVIDKWIETEVEGAKFSDSYNAMLTERYQSAKSKLEQVSAFAIIILPQSMADILVSVERKLADDNYDSWIDEIEAEGAAINAAMGNLLLQAKQNRLVKT